MAGQPRVLFIDDQPDRVNPTRAILAAAGWSALFAQTGEDALWGIDRDPPDCLVVDLSAAVLDGWFVLARVGGRPARPRLIAVSPDDADHPRARELGADLCVTTHSQLADAIVRDGVTAIA